MTDYERIELDRYLDEEDSKVGFKVACYNDGKRTEGIIVGFNIKEKLVLIAVELSSDYLKEIIAHLKQCYPLVCSKCNGSGEILKIPLIFSKLRFGELTQGLQDRSTIKCDQCNKE
jgi:hypothetical protein